MRHCAVTRSRRCTRAMVGCVEVSVCLVGGGVGWRWDVAAGRAEGAGEPITAVTRIAPPFVIDAGIGRFDGYNEDLQLISGQLGRPIGTPVAATNVTDVLGRVEQKEAILGSRRCRSRANAMPMTDAPKSAGG
jgi:hypothetical protein